jgi:DNA-binding HxlR family transcriptional regulator
VAPSAAGDREACPVLKTAELIQSKWTLLVLRDLSAGINRFSRLERSLVGISPKTLSERLKCLEETGIVTRKAYPEVPPRVEYALTPMGRDLIPLIEHMREYGSKWLMGADRAPGATPGDSEHAA